MGAAFPCNGLIGDLEKRQYQLSNKRGESPRVLRRLGCLSQATMAKVTHEAAVGTVDQKQLETLMAHGLTPEQAVDVIIMGLLR